MLKRRLWPLGLAALSLAALPFAARAQDKPAPAQAGGSVPGWGEFMESLATLPDRMLARLPEPIRTDPQVRQEAARPAPRSRRAEAIAFAVCAERSTMRCWRSLCPASRAARANTCTCPR